VGLENFPKTGAEGRGQETQSGSTLSGGPEKVGRGQRVNKEEIWQELNQRQRDTLTAVYRADQNAEQSEAARWRRGSSRRAAEIWRRLQYPPFGGVVETPLHRLLREAGVIDPGLGSTLQALERRNLIQCGWTDGDLLWVRLANLGRAIARGGLGEQPPRKAPKRQLKPRQWEALTTAYHAGDEGIKDNAGVGDYGGFSYRWTWARLRDYYAPDDGLISELRYWENGKGRYKIQISPKGREFYEINKEFYENLYPKN